MRGKVFQPQQPAAIDKSVLLKFGGEGEFAAPISSGDYRRSLPSVGSKAVVSAKPRAHLSGSSTVQPHAPIALRTPLTHAGDVGEQVVDNFWRCGDFDALAPTLRRRHELVLIP